MLKYLLGLLCTLLLASTAAQAQGNGCGSGGNNNNLSSSTSTQAQTSPYQNWSPPVRQWLEAGGQGQIPVVLSVRVRLEARPWLMQTFGLSNGQIVQKWANGEITVTYLPSSPPTPTLSFRVSYGGGQIIIDIEDQL